MKHLPPWRLGIFASLAIVAVLMGVFGSGTGTNATQVTKSFDGYHPELGNFSLDVTYDSSQVSVSFLDTTTSDDSLVSIDTVNAPSTGQDNEHMFGLPIDAASSQTTLVLLAIAGTAAVLTLTTGLYFVNGLRTAGDGQRQQLLEFGFASHKATGITGKVVEKRRRETGRIALNSLFKGIKSYAFMLSTIVARSQAPRMAFAHA